MNIITDMKGTYIGEFEELVMLSVGSLHPTAYGVSVKAQIKETTGRIVTLSAVHAALNRLEEKGFLKSSFGEASSIRGGKRKRIFTITAYGSKALQEARTQREELFKSIPKVALHGN